MKIRKIIKGILASTVLITSLPSLAASGVYGGGPLYNNTDYSISELKASGFSHVIAWTIHINKDGDLNFNAEFPLVADGKYIGDKTHPKYKQDIASLKIAPSKITRVEMGLSGYGSSTFDNVRDLINCSQSHCGTGPKSILYRNFKMLKDTFPTVDAFNNDDEDTYDLASSVKFHIMLADLGFKGAIVPYQEKSFWKSLVDQVNNARPGAIDLLYLQAYAGGSKNNPCDWDVGLPVYVGLWSKDFEPKALENKMRSWQQSCPSVVQGGFMWLYDDFDNSPRVKAYSQAINNVFDVK